MIKCVPNDDGFNLLNEAKNPITCFSEQYWGKGKESYSLCVKNEFFPEKNRKKARIKTIFLHNLNGKHEKYA